MNFDKLVHFARIYETKSISRASEDLMLSKTALSLSLKSLEGDLGLQLFTRSNKQMLPTSEGTLFYGRISPILSQVSELKKEMADEALEFSGHIRLGAPICFGSEKLAPFISTFKAKYPKAKISLFLEAGEETKLKLRDGELDFAIVGDDVGLRLPSSVHLEKIFEYELTLCTGRNFFETNIKGKKLTQRLLEELPFISLMNVSNDEWFKAHFNRSPSIKNNFSLNNHHAHINQIISSEGVGIQSLYSIEEYLRTGQLIEIRPTSKKVIYNFYSIQLYNQVPSKILKEFIFEFKKFLYN